MTSLFDSLLSLGYGIITPFQRDEKNDWANAGGVALVNSRIKQILTTKGDSPLGPGELPWRSAFGSRLDQLRHRNITTTTVAIAEQIIVDSVSKWERSVKVTKVIRVFNEDPRVLALEVFWRLVDGRGATRLEGSLPISIP